MIKTPLSTVIGGAFWTPGATVIGGQQNLTQLIKSLFSNNEVGFAYDPNDLTTLYQDAAGTIPVTTAGQPVGLVKDKSGRNNHAYQTVSASRPILQRNATTGAYYLAFDGADDFLVTNRIDFTGTDEVSLFAGFRRADTASLVGMLLEFSSSTNANTGAFYISVPDSTQYLKSIAFVSKGTSLSRTSILAYIEPSVVVSAQAKISTDTNTISLNGVRMGSNASDQGTVNYGNYPLYIGRRGGASLPFNGHLYSLIGVGRLSTDSETIALEKSIAKNTGVTL